MGDKGLDFKHKEVINISKVSYTLYDVLNNFIVP